MKKLVILIISFLFIISCTEVKITQHPDFNFPPTYPYSKVKVYQMMRPVKDFFVIGKITVDSTWSLSRKQFIESIQKKAATIGGDAVILTDKYANIYALKTGSSTQGTGTATTSGRTTTINYNETTSDDYMFIPVEYYYGYVIKFKK